MRGRGRYIRANLRHDGNQCHLPHISGFARHIRAGDDSNAVFPAVEQSVVRDEQTVGQHFLNNRVTAVLDVNAVGKIHHRTNIVVITCHISQSAQNVKRCDSLRGFLHAVYLGGNLVTHRGKHLILESGQAFLRTEHGALELFQLLGDIALAVRKRLLTNVVLRNRLRIGAADLDIIAEHAVVADFQLANAGTLAFRLLDFGNFTLTAGRKVAQTVNLLVEALADHAAFPKKNRRLIHDGLLDQRTDVFKQINLAGQLTQHSLSEQSSLRFDLRQARNCRRQRTQITAVCSAVGYAPNQALHIEHSLECVRQCRAGNYIVAQCTYRLLTACNMQRIIQRFFNPLTNQARTHCRARVVKHPQQRALLLLGAHGLAKLEIAACDQVKLHILALMVHLQLIQTGKAGLLRLLEVIQQTAEALHSARQVSQTGSVKVLHLEVLLNAFRTALRLKALLRHRLDERLQTFLQKGLKAVCRNGSAADQHLARRKASELAGDVIPVIRAGRVHRTCRNISKAYADGTTGCIYAAEKVVPVFIQHGGFHDRTRCHASDDLALDQTFCLFRVLHLLTDCNFVTLLHQLGNIAFRTVIRYAAHRCTFSLTAVAAGQRQLQLAGDQLGIVKEHFVEIAQTVKQNIIFIFVFDLKILLHHGRQFSHVLTSFL